MSGLASMNRYHQFDWQHGAPYAGEVEYLAGCELRRKPVGYAYERQGGGCYNRKSVKSDTLVNRGARP